MVDLVGARDELRRGGRQPLSRACARSTTSARRRSASTRPRSSTTASAAARAATRSSSSRRPRGVGFAGALEYARRPLRGRARAGRGEDPRGGRAPRASASACSSCWSAPPPSTCATCGTRREAARRAGVPGRARPRRGRRCASSASATRRARGTRCCSPRARPGSATASSSTPGSRSGRRARGSIYDRFRRRIMFPLCDPRGRVLGFGARAMGADQKPKYLNSTDGVVFHKGRHLFGADHRARAGRARRARSSSPRATPTSSRCTRPGCATRSG